MCAQIFNIMNIDVPAGVGAPPLDTQQARFVACHFANNCDTY